MAVVMQRDVKKLTTQKNESNSCSEREVIMGTTKHQNGGINGNVRNFDSVSSMKVNVTWRKWQITAAILVATQVAGQL
jgi:hypothetical protein